MFRLNFQIAILFLVFTHCSNLNAHIINVPDDFETIQGAINESDRGDTVLVQPGEYVENINFRGRAITVASLILTTNERAYIDSTIIDGDERDCVVSFENEEDTTSVLQGFTVQNGIQMFGGGIDCQGTSPLLMDLRITGNRAQQLGGGLYSNNGGYPFIRRTVIEENVADQGGGLCLNSSRITMKDVIIRRNNSNLNAGGIYLSSSSMNLEYVTIVENEVTNDNGKGGGIYDYQGVGIILRNVTISRNIAANGSGIYQGNIYDQDNGTLMVNTIVTDNVDENILINLRADNTFIVSYSDIEGGQDGINGYHYRDAIVWGEGNIDEDPAFVNPDEGDFNLIQDSPCIDTGDPDSPRDPDLTRADMGGLPYFQSGVVEGFVLDLAVEEPLADAVVSVHNFASTRTDEEGFFRFSNAPLEEFEITASFPGYNDLTLHDQQVDNDDTLSVVFRLTHPLFLLSEDRIYESLDAGDSTEVELIITNQGDGALEWQAKKRLTGESGADPWELRRSYSVSETVHDARIEGVVFIDNHFYVSGYNNFGGDDGENLIYVLDRDGQEVNRFPQFGESHYSMRDLAWNGELIWGCDDNMVVGFTTEGDSITSFEGPENDLSVITWDSDHEVLWVARKTGRGISAMKRDGNEVDSLQLPRYDFRLYGLAYWSDDPDSCNLYVLHCPDNQSQVLHKINTETGDTMFVASLEPEEGGQPGGTFITNTYDPRCWVFVSIANNSGDDRIDIWQLESNLSWFTLDPIIGEVEAESSQDLDILISSAGLPVINIQAELVFSHNAAGGETILPVTLTIRPDAVEEGDNLLIPDEFAITSIYPNPFNSTTMITYSLPVANTVELRLFDLTGREVASLVNEFKQAGIHSTALSATDLPSGMYFVKLAAVNQSITKKILLIR